MIIIFYFTHVSHIILLMCLYKVYPFEVWKMKKKMISLTFHAFYKSVPPETVHRSRARSVGCLWAWSCRSRRSCGWICRSVAGRAQNWPAITLWAQTHKMTYILRMFFTRFIPLPHSRFIYNTYGLIKVGNMDRNLWPAIRHTQHRHIF